MTDVYRSIVDGADLDASLGGMNDLVDDLTPQLGGDLDVNGNAITAGAGVGIVGTDGTLHVHTASAGVVTAPATADDLVVENSTSAGISILSTNATSGSLNFGSPADSSKGLLNFNNVSDIFVLGTTIAGGTIRLETGNGALAIAIDASQDVTFEGDIIIAGNVDGRNVATDGAKLDLIEASATIDQTAAEILTALLTVDGTGSGLDADLLDGVELAALLLNTTDTFTGNLDVVGTAGVGIARTDGTFHVSTATAGTVAAPAQSDELVLENSTDCGLTILAPDADFSQISFGSPTTNVGAFINYNYDDSLMKIATNVTGDAMAFFTNSNDAAFTLDSTGDSHPGADNTLTTGTASFRWNEIFSTNTTINTSDGREKRDIIDSPLGLDFITSLRPVSYKWIVGQNKVVQAIEPGGKSTLEPMAGVRPHYGLVAQEVKLALDAAGVDDFAGWILVDKDDADSQQGLRYGEFIAPMIAAITELKTKNDSLKALLVTKGVITRAEADAI